VSFLIKSAPPNGQIIWQIARIEHAIVVLILFTPALANKEQNINSSAVTKREEITNSK
jgi:hypothetical protein